MATEGRTGSSGAGGGDGDGVPTAVIEELVASPERRALLRLLIERGEPVPVGDVAAHLAAEVGGAADWRALRTEIYQDHLPKLTAPGVVAFDSMLGTITYEGGDALAARLAALEDDSKDK